MPHKGEHSYSAREQQLLIQILQAIVLSLMVKVKNQYLKKYLNITQTATLYVNSIYFYKMSIKINIAANFFASIWTALMSLAFIPYYIKLMGMESYGLVGFMASIQAIAILLDLGLAQSLNRELAKLSINPDSGN